MSSRRKWLPLSPKTSPSTLKLDDWHLHTSETAQGKGVTAQGQDYEEGAEKEASFSSYLHCKFFLTHAYQPRIQVACDVSASFSELGEGQPEHLNTRSSPGGERARDTEVQSKSKLIASL